MDYANLESLATLAPFLALAGIVASVFTFASKLTALKAKDGPQLQKSERISLRLDLAGSLVVAATGSAALWAILST